MTNVGRGLGTCKIIFMVTRKKSPLWSELKDVRKETENH